jgi:hypothetical protein
LFLYLTIKHYAMKAYEGVDVQIQIFLTSALAGGELHAPTALPAEKEPPVPIGKWAPEPVWTT